ncbi:7463_t:CDS:2 [Dentiscutata erythropus]|uniref:7463_t:CDS:1 n=1 Tax=Dentiscutata erythropus TaxID=1348616 RepID=A0A9N9IUV7_9GLOM|nr:7463_t:CDS:2 [Dentiscutata erythropus]
MSRIGIDENSASQEKIVSMSNESNNQNNRLLPNTRHNIEISNSANMGLDAIVLVVE